MTYIAHNYMILHYINYIYTCYTIHNFIHLHNYVHCARNACIQSMLKNVYQSMECSYLLSKYFAIDDIGYYCIQVKYRYTVILGGHIAIADVFFWHMRSSMLAAVR